MNREAARYAGGANHPTASRPKPLTVSKGARFATKSDLIRVAMAAVIDPLRCTARCIDAVLFNQQLGRPEDVGVRGQATSQRVIRG